MKLSRWLFLPLSLLLAFGAPSVGKWYCADGRLCPTCHETAYSHEEDAAKPDVSAACRAAHDTLAGGACRSCCHYVLSKVLARAAQHVQPQSLALELPPLTAASSVSCASSRVAVIALHRAPAPPLPALSSCLIAPRAPPVVS